MQIANRVKFGVVSMVLVAGFGGCGSGGGGDSSTTEATVKGVVKLNGKPATEGEIHFDPSSPNRPTPIKVGAIGKDGSYTVTTFTGPNGVKLGGSLAKKYGVLAYRNKSFTVQPGENTFDFETDTK